jgi:hypothetical protein
MPDEMGELEGSLANTSDQGGDQLSQPYVEDNGQAEQLTTTSRQTQENAGRTEIQKLLAGKYKTPQDLEKGYLEQNKGYQKMRQDSQTRAQQLERLINNPRFQQMAQNDPDMIEALGKLGYELEREEARQDTQTGGGAWNGDTNDPRFQVAVLRAEMQFNQQRGDLQEELGRKLSSKEWDDIKAQIRMAPRLSVKNAWKLTDSYDKHVQATQQKAIDQAMKKAPVSRPRPAQAGAGFQNAPKGKSPLGLGEQDKAAFLNDLINKSEGGA